MRGNHKQEMNWRLLRYEILFVNVSGGSIRNLINSVHCSIKSKAGISVRCNQKHMQPGKLKLPIKNLVAMI
jgi:hypothetical protein